MANKFEQTLENIGKAFLKIFADVEKVATVAEPFVDVAFPVIAPVYNAAANGAAAAQAAGAKAVVPGASSTENLINIAAAVEPILVQFAKQGGLSAPTTATILKYAGAVQQSLQASQTASPAPAPPAAASAPAASK